MVRAGFIAEAVSVITVTQMLMHIHNLYTVCMHILRELCESQQNLLVYAEVAPPRHCSSFMWHQPCQHYTTSVDIQKCAVKS